MVPLRPALPHLLQPWLSLGAAHSLSRSNRRKGSEQVANNTAADSLVYSLDTPRRDSPSVCQVLWCLLGRLCSPPLSLCLLLLQMADGFCHFNSLSHMLVTLWSVGSERGAHVICVQTSNIVVHHCFSPRTHMCTQQFATSAFLPLKKIVSSTIVINSHAHWLIKGLVHTHGALLFFLNYFYSNNLEPPPTLTTLDVLTAIRRFLCSACWLATWSVTASWKDTLVGFVEKDSTILLILRGICERIQVRHKLNKTNL